jgi:quercetin dioxygenase-like cupin family protein
MKFVIVTGVLSAAVLSAALAAQSPSFKRTVLQQGDLSAPGREVVQALVEFQPNGTPGPHTHPGEEVGYVVDGSIRIEIAGRPAATLNAGQGFLIPANTVHNAVNVSASNAHLVATYIVEKGKPLATPAPAK